MLLKRLSAVKGLVILNWSVILLRQVKSPQLKFTIGAYWKCVSEGVVLVQISCHNLGSEMVSFFYEQH